MLTELYSLLFTLYFLFSERFCERFTNGQRLYYEQDHFSPGKTPNRNRKEQIMLNPSMLEIMVDDIQTERRHEADLDRLSKAGKTAARFQERLSHFLVTLGAKEKKQPQAQTLASKF